MTNNELIDAFFEHFTIVEFGKTETGITLIYIHVKPDKENNDESSKSRLMKIEARNSL